MNHRDQEKIFRVLSLLDSDQEGEVLKAVKMAKAILSKNDKSLYEFMTNKIEVSTPKPASYNADVTNTDEKVRYLESQINRLTQELRISRSNIRAQNAYMEDLSEKDDTIFRLRQEIRSLKNDIKDKRNTIRRLTKWV